MSRTKNTVIAVIILVVLAVGSLIYSAVTQSETDAILKNGVATVAAPVKVEAYGQSGMSRSDDTQQKYRAVFSFTVAGSSYLAVKDDFNSEGEAQDFLSSGERTVRYLEADPQKARLVE